MLRGVITQLVPFGLGQDAEECWIAVRYPMAEGKAAYEDGDPSKDGIEEVEGAHGAHTDEVEQRPLNAQIGERLVQALENSICAAFLLCFVGHIVLFISVARNGIAGRATNSPYTPQSQLSTFTARTAMPVPAATPASAFFAPGSPCAKP